MRVVPEEKSGKRRDLFNAEIIVERAELPQDKTHNENFKSFRNMFKRKKP
jgi:hypothetical protein